MNTMLIDFAVGIAIFVLGIALTVRRFARQDYLVITVSAVLTPVLALIAVFCVLYLAIRGRLSLDPCPDGFEEAEKIVEIHRQQLYGGALRPPALAASWKQAYERELQRETGRVQRVARRYLAAV